MPQLCTGVALAGNELIVALRHALYRFDPGPGVLTHLVDVEHPSEDQRLNELKVDACGRAWIGSMRDFGVAISGSLYCISPQLHVRRAWGEIRIPNGLAWSPDGRTMYFTDSGIGQISSYVYDPATGVVGQQRTLLEAGALPGHPDGSIVDSEGFVWNARFGGGCIARISPWGSIDTVIELPVSQPTSCALGGADLRTLYITTASQKLDFAQRAQQSWAGHLLELRVPVPGIRESDFTLQVV